MIVVEAKIEDKGETYRILLRLCFFLSAISRRYFVDAHIKDLPLNELKKAYIQRYGISGRHCNSIRYEIDGKVKAWEEGKALRQSKKTGQVKATKKTLERLNKKTRDLRSLRTAKRNYQAKIKAWRDAGRGGKKPKLPANLRKEARNLTQLGHELRRTLFLIHQKKRRLSISERELGQLEKQTKPSICFGSRRLFRKQFQIDEKNQAARDSWSWSWDWQFARSSSSRPAATRENSYQERPP